MENHFVSLADHRTGESYALRIENGAIRALDLRRIKTSEDDFGLVSYDPAYTNTASCKSAITFIDGDIGRLCYRGYPIEELAEHCNYLQIAYLLLYGELPTGDLYPEWESEIQAEADVPQTAKNVLRSFPREAHPTRLLAGCLAGLSAVYPESTRIQDASVRRRQAIRLIAQTPGIAACCYRHGAGLPDARLDTGSSYPERFMRMVWGGPGTDFEPHPVLTRALDILFILHADLEQNCSASTMRQAGSSHCDPYLAMTAAVSALSGPLHGGANEAVLRMLNEIGSARQVQAYLDRVKAGEVKLMGFGHRVFKNYDPRARIIREISSRVFEVAGQSPALEIALELERAALADDYFVQRRIYPNIDFYSGLIYQAMGFPPAMFTVLFAVARTAGWLAQWEEMLNDPEQRIAHPRQIYIGRELRHVDA